MNATFLAEIAVIVLCLAGGGLLKGATGAGAPILAIPALAAFFDVRFAVIVMLFPNLLTNLWQAVRFRTHILGWTFMLPLLAGGFLGAGLGTLALKAFDPDILSLGVAVAVLFYVVIRLLRPHWSLPMGPAHWLSAPAGLLAGLLQGGTGLSAPVSITFLNALRLPRESFIATISALFVTFSVIQIAIASTNGLIRDNEIFYSLFALVPVSLAMPLGAALARKLSPLVLDRIILAVLAMLSAKLLLEAVF